MLSSFAEQIGWNIFRSLVPHPPRPAPAPAGPRHLLSQDNSEDKSQQLLQQFSTTTVAGMEESNEAESELLKAR